MEPTAEDSPIKKFLVDRGEGIHHVAITADDIEKDISRATANGMKILGGLRLGSYGRRITFIHPKSINGVLMEFCEAPAKGLDYFAYTRLVRLDINWSCILDLS